MKDLAWIIADNKKMQAAYDNAAQTLYNPQRQLNRGEAYRRLDTWLAARPSEYTHSVIKLLVTALWRDEA
jgi:hypothetical protein